MYKDFPDPPINEGTEYTFTCQTTNGVPRSVIRWEITGNPTDVTIKQTNSTNIQTSELTLTAHRSFTSIQCIGDQVHNKPSVIGEVKPVNVFCKYPVYIIIARC